jgi:hypothetical protein
MDSSKQREVDMEILVGIETLTALGLEDAKFAIGKFAIEHELQIAHAAEILEDVAANWENDHRRFPEPLTFDALLSEASEGMAEARAYDEEFDREMH